jgi:hypothetical protein
MGREVIIGITVDNGIGIMNQQFVMCMDVEHGLL